MWQQVASGLKPTNHPIIIPDLLGYDGTDKPTDPAEYRWDHMTKDLTEILDAENVQKCISIGHDWGSGCASRFYQYPPDRVVGLVNLNVPYLPLGRAPFDLDAYNALTEGAFGYPLYSYWYFFTAADGAAVIQGDLDVFHDMLHASGEGMKDFFCAKDGMRNPLEHKTKPEIAVRGYAKDPAFKQAFIERMKRDGFEAPLAWYKAMTTNVHYESESRFLMRDRWSMCLRCTLAARRISCAGRS